MKFLSVLCTLGGVLQDLVVEHRGVKDQSQANGIWLLFRGLSQEGDGNTVVLFCLLKEGEKMPCRNLTDWSHKKI